jgi:hypothetical protein
MEWLDEWREIYRSKMEGGVITCEGKFYGEFLLQVQYSHADI